MIPYHPTGVSSTLCGRLLKDTTGSTDTFAICIDPITVQLFAFVKDNVVDVQNVDSAEILIDD